MNPNCHQRNEVGKATFMRGTHFFSKEANVSCATMSLGNREQEEIISMSKNKIFRKREQGVNISNLNEPGPNITNKKLDFL